ncbi:hypothetical protein [Cytobacillus praedii]|uniref:hypothetical protein n=1 Tax=Cytobacillus praedii TaxID=1742358 RepID=UPI003F81990D
MNCKIKVGMQDKSVQMLDKLSKLQDKKVRLLDKSVQMVDKLNELQDKSWNAR